MGELVKFDDKKVFLDGHTDKIKKTIKTITKDYMYIAFLLWEVREYQYYDGLYKDTVEYAEKDLDMSRSTANRYIQLCENFSKRTSLGNNPTYTIHPAYESYSIGKMFEMLSMKPEDRDLITIDMTEKQIKELKKKLKEDRKAKCASTRNIVENENVTRLKIEKPNELRCENCGKIYFVDDVSRKQWIVINGKPVASCCFSISYDTDLLKLK